MVGFARFVLEDHKMYGQEYTPHSLYIILVGFQRYICQERLSDEKNIFQYIAFNPLINVCDSIFKKLHSKGIVTEEKVTL